KLRREGEKIDSALSALASLEDRFLEFGKKENEASAARENYVRLEANYEKYNCLFLDLERSFFRGQAGLFASELREGDPCPVCGSTEHPKRAERLPGAPGEEELEKARADMAKARDARDGAARKISLLSGELRSTESRLFADAKIEAPDGTPDTMREALAARKAERMAERGELALAIANAEARVKRAEELRGLTASLSETQNALQEAKKEAEAVLSNREREYARLGGEAEALARDLPDTDGRAARRLLDERREELERLTEAFQAAKSDYDRCLEEKNRARTVLAERSARKGPLERARDGARGEFLLAVAKCAFPGEEEYRASLLPAEQRAEMEAACDAYHSAVEATVRDVARLEAETAGKEYTDLAALAERQIALEAAFRADEEALRRRRSRFDANSAAHQKMDGAGKDIEESEKRYRRIKALADTAAGDLDGKAKLTFEAYVQAAYFTQILRAANRRFSAMSENRYELRRREAASDLRSRTGLEIDVFDHYTGKARDVRSLSGGESFKASLALALGLSDVVAETSGGVKLDAMFIDEGFGSLDAESLDAAVRTLESVAGGNRLVGIISHVGELRNRIDGKIVVKRTKSGSTVSVVS
ncbi:SMC family ATPase, partial [Oscillospiraceae bacterium OttesenSCG-928-G22]|nr:SMC family ATPase [Oscillospiraceae bacterium OttesenSCG-928-G22]